MKSTTAHSVSRPQQQDHRHVNATEERAAIHVEQRAVTFAAHHRPVGHIVLVSPAFLVRREPQNVNAFSLETVARPRDQPGAYALRGNFNPVVQISDRATRSNLLITPETRVPFFV